MEDFFNQTLSVMESAFRSLESQIPPPRLVPFKHGFVYRYKEQSAHQALVQKLARVVSGLHSARLLHKNGFVQEQGAIQRMMDEFNEDILFLTLGLTVDKFTELHQSYLSAFYEEEFDNPNEAVSSTQKRAMVPRKKIRAYIARIAGRKFNPSLGIEVSRTVSKAYSGFVHGASPHIMDIYCGTPPKFCISGLTGTPRIKEHYEDLWNYFYRGLLSFIAVAKAFGNEDLFKKLRSYQNYFEKQSGTNFGESVRSKT